MQEEMVTMSNELGSSFGIVMGALALGMLVLGCRTETPMLLDGAAQTGGMNEGSGSDDEADSGGTSSGGTSSGGTNSGLESGSGSGEGTSDSEPACGNGVVEGDEECDGNEDLDGDGAPDGLYCRGYGFPAGVAWCTKTCSLDVSGCTNCGNGVIDDDEEQCDGGDLGGETCTSLNPDYMGGTLACDGTCSFDFRNCMTR